MVEKTTGLAPRLRRPCVLSRSLLNRYGLGGVQVVELFHVGAQYFGQLVPLEMPEVTLETIQAALGEVSPGVVAQLEGLELPTRQRRRRGRRPSR